MLDKLIDLFGGVMNIFDIFETDYSSLYKINEEQQAIIDRKQLIKEQLIIEGKWKFDNSDPLKSTLITDNEEYRKLFSIETDCIILVDPITKEETFYSKYKTNVDNDTINDQAKLVELESDSSDELQKNVNILNELAIQESFMELQQDEDTGVIFDESGKDEQYKERQAFYKCNGDEDEYLFYKSMVDSNIATGDDILIKQDNFIEHDTMIKEAVDNSILLGHSNEKIILRLSLLLKQWGYSKNYCMSVVTMYMERFMEDIMVFRQHRHLFTENDIQLELNTPKEYQDRVQKIVELFSEGKIDDDTLMKQFFIMMKKRGYSDNFIKFTMEKTVKTLINDINDSSDSN